MELLFVAIASVVVCGALGRHVAAAKGRSRAEGTLFGVLLGPVGVLVEALLPQGPGDPPPPPRSELRRDRDDVDGFDLRRVIEKP